MTDETMSCDQRVMRARIGSYTSWARTADRTARTAPARAASLARFEAQVDPHGALSDTERATRAEAARKAYFTGLAYRSSRSRSKAAEARRRAAALDAEATAAEAELASDSPGGAA